MTTVLTLPKWYDLHVHLRQGDLLRPLIEQHAKMGCAGVLAMPNTQPPVTKVYDDEAGEGFSIQTYLQMIRQAGGDVFKTIIVPLYLSPHTTPAMIERGAKNGLLKATKYYPPHGTTNSESSAALSQFMKNGVLQAMQDNDVVLCFHGEVHGLSGENFFGRHSNAEEAFYREVAPRLADKFPRLRMVGEHITTKVGVDFINQAGANVTASVTPQHLLYTVGDLLQGLKYHLYCMPVMKFTEDVEALRAAVIASDNNKFFAGTDSAPHTTKITGCCGAAGCYTGGIAPQLYADAFEKAGVNLGEVSGASRLKNFLCLNGARFYGLEIPAETFTLAREPQEIGLINTPAGVITPLAIGMQTSVKKTATLNWTVR